MDRPRRTKTAMGPAERGMQSMELKVFKDTIAAYGGRRETRLELPVETEILIPDYLPAVFKIVKCLVEPVILQNHTAASKWQGEGYLRCTVYYQSDEAGAQLYRMEQKFPFEKTADLPETGCQQGPATVSGELEYVNCRAISEHRIDLRGAYALNVSVQMVDQLELVSSLADCGIEQRTRVLNGKACAAAEEKTFTAETHIAVPGSDAVVLDISGSFQPESVTVLTGQANCQGTLRVQAVYRLAGTEELMACTAELPVRQTLDMTGAAEGDECLFWGEVLACTLEASDSGHGDPALTVTWKLHAELWHDVQYTAVADAYSTICQTQVDTQSCRLLTPAAELPQTVQAEVSDELPDPDAQVLGCFVTLGAPVAQPGEEPDTVLFAGKGTAHLLCCDARGELTCYDKTFSWQLPQTMPGTAADYCLRAHACASRITSGKAGSRMQVSVEIRLTGRLFAVQTCPAVREVTLGEEFPDKAEGPALYLYYASAGERIFDIAKRYHARAKDLVAANHLEADADTPVQEMTTETACLLIPAAL